MKDSLLNHYNEELGAIHKTAAEFAKAHPRVANHLHLGQKRSDDPFINHLIESFAFMSARVRNQIEDDDSRISESLLSVLYPHYLKPFPSCAIMQMQAKDNCPNQYTIEKNTALAVDYNDTTLRFTTGYDIDITPISITNANLTHWTTADKNSKLPTGLESCLNLTLQLAEDTDSNQFSLNKLSVYLNCHSEYRDDLFNLLMEHCQAIAIKNEHGELVERKNWRIQNRGMKENELLTPCSAQSNKSHHLISEYFQFTDKFFFIDLILPELTTDENGQIDLYLYFDRHSSSLAKTISAEDILTNCTPVINLYQTEAEPIQVNCLDQSYAVNADPYQPHHYHGVYSIDHVVLHQHNGDSESISPFYAAHEHSTQSPTAYWASELQPHWQTDSQSSSGYDTCIRIIGNQTHPTEKMNATCELSITATNHQLPQEIIPSVHSIYFWDSDHANVCQPNLITAMSQSRFVCKDQASQWQLVSLISQQHHLLGQQNDAKQWIQSYLSLFDPGDQKEMALISAAIEKVESKPIVRRHPNSARLGNCQGIAITILIDENVLSAHAFYPFALLMKTFFIENTSLNSFIELQLDSLQQGRIAHWPAEIGLESCL